MGITKQVIQFRISWLGGDSEKAVYARGEAAGFWPRLATRGQVLGPLASCQAAAMRLLVAVMGHGFHSMLREHASKQILSADGWRSTKGTKTIIKSAQCMKRQVQLRMGRSVSMACSLHIKPIVAAKRRQSCQTTSTLTNDAK